MADSEPLEASDGTNSGNADCGGCDDGEALVDGRAARRQRNIDVVIDVVLEMFGEELLLPTIEQAATRSGLSLRSLYRYFADPGELLAATIKRSRQRGLELSRLHNIGQGSLEDRVDDFVDMRLRLHDSVGAVFRATVVNAVRHQGIGGELAKNRNEMRTQFELQFAPELDQMNPTEHQVAVTAGDLLTQLDSIDLLVRHRQLGVDEIRHALTAALLTLLG